MFRLCVRIRCHGGNVWTSGTLLARHRQFYQLNIRLTTCRALMYTFSQHRFSAFWLRSKCSICSYQLNIWYGGHVPRSILNWFLQGDEVQELAPASSRVGLALQYRQDRPTSPFNSRYGQKLWMMDKGKNLFLIDNSGFSSLSQKKKKVCKTNQGN